MKCIAMMNEHPRFLKDIYNIKCQLMPLRERASRQSIINRGHHFPHERPGHPIKVVSASSITEGVSSFGDCDGNGGMQYRAESQGEGTGYYLMATVRTLSTSYGNWKSTLEKRAQGVPFVW